MGHFVSKLHRALLWAALHHALCGFVLLGAEKNVLPVNPDSPTIAFYWDGKAPSISEKDKYRDGAYAHLDNTSFMQQILADAVSLWNAVPGAYIVLTIAESDAPVALDEKDERNSIVVQSSNNISSAAYALPRPEKGVIKDCDISISSNRVTAQSLVFTVAHEFGHCLGLGHAHSNYNALMGYSRSRRDLSLGADDIAGLIFLYPDPKYGSSEMKSKICGVVGRQTLGSAAQAVTSSLLLMPLLLSLGALLRRKLRA